MKVCYVASSGGHLEELMCLQPIIEKYESFLVTESGEEVNDSIFQNIFRLDQINRRERMFLLNFIKLFYRAFKIIRAEKPDVILTTGALVAFPFCIIGKIFKKKVIYIESFTRIEGKSLTGRLVYPFADLFIVQWEEMLKYYPKAQYGGKIF